MKKRLKENGLSIAFGALFLATLAGQFFSGYQVNQEEERRHGGAAQTLAGYAASGHFLEAVFENWESEFLQMAMYVLLSAFLYQKGSAESKKFQNDSVDEDPGPHRRDPRAPWPVKKGGAALGLYRHSLCGALFLLFIVSFWLHACAGLENHNEELLQHGGRALTHWEYLSGSQFWFESFQNWQSEFLSVAVLVVFTVFLRQGHSPQSKPVFAPHDETGKE